MEKYINLAYKKSLIKYYLVFGIAIFVALIGYLIHVNYTMSISETIPIVFTSVSYLYMCISIPFGLWNYNRKIKTINAQISAEERYNFYMKNVKNRILIVSPSFLINILFFYLFGSQSFIYASAIGAVALLFCKPNKSTIDAELDPINDEL